MPLVEIRSVIRRYGGLRPFRLRELSVGAGEVVAIGGPDERAAAVLTDLLTGATLPDEGEVLVRGRSTASVQGADDWLVFLDQFGLVNPRVALLDELSVAQNLAITRTLDVDPMSTEASEAAARSAEEVGLDAAQLGRRLSEAPALTRFRVRLGRALANDPAILVVEHPSLDLDRDDVVESARLIRRIGERRQMATLVVSADAEVLRHAGTRELTWRPATGELVRPGRWHRWLQP